MAEQKILTVVEDNLLIEEESSTVTKVVELQSPATLEEGPIIETEGLAHVELIQLEELFNEIDIDEGGGVEEDEATGLEEILPTVNDKHPAAKRSRLEEEDPGLTANKCLQAADEDPGTEDK